MKPQHHQPQQQTTAQRLTRAKVRILLEQPFFGTLALRLKLVLGCLPTMATDGSRIVYNPAFVDQLKPAELEGTLAHEVLHCALRHHCRRGERDPELWNQAADLVINPILLGNGFTLPAGALIDPAFNNLSAEEIYARLLPRRLDGGAAPKQKPQQTNGGGGLATGSQETQDAGIPDPRVDAAVWLGTWFDECAKVFVLETELGRRPVRSQKGYRGYRPVVLSIASELATHRRTASKHYAVTRRADLQKFPVSKGRGSWEDLSLTHNFAASPILSHICATSSRIEIESSGTGLVAARDDSPPTACLPSFSAAAHIPLRLRRRPSTACLSQSSCDAVPDNPPAAENRYNESSRDPGATPFASLQNCGSG